MFAAKIKQLSFRKGMKMLTNIALVIFWIMVPLLIIGLGFYSLYKMRVIAPNPKVSRIAKEHDLTTEQKRELYDIAQKMDSLLAEILRKNVLETREQSEIGRFDRYTAAFAQAVTDSDEEVYDLINLSTDDESVKSAAYEYWHTGLSPEYPPVVKNTYAKG